MRVKIGAAELELLRHIHAAGPISVREAQEQFGQAKGLTRGTVLQMMERLRKKGFLVREDVDKVYRYTSVRSPAEFEGDIVAQFVSGHLGGSIKPFLNYLEESGSVSDQDLEELQQLVDKLSGQAEGPKAMSIEALVDRLFWAGIAATIPLAVVALLIVLLPNAPSLAKLWALRIGFCKCLLLLAAWPRPLFERVFFLPVRPGSFGPGTFAPGDWPKGLVVGALSVSCALVLSRILPLARHLAEVRRVAKTSVANMEGELLEKYHRAAERVGSSSVPLLRSSLTARGPVIVGLKNQVVVLPERLVGSLREADIELVVAHELHHFKRRDAFWSCLPLTVSLALPWHPLVWWASKQHSRLTEESCDEAVVGEDDASREPYARLLLQVASKEGLPDPRGLVAYGVSATKQQLESRIRRIYTSCSRPVRLASGVLLVAASAFVLSPVRIAVCSPPLLGSDSMRPVDAPRYSVRVIPIPDDFTQGFAVGFDPSGNVIVNFENKKVRRQIARVDPSGRLDWLTADRQRPDSAAFFVTPGGTVCGMATYPLFGGAYSAAWDPGSSTVHYVPNPLGPGGWCRGADDNGTYVGTSDVQMAWIQRPGQPSVRIVLPTDSDYSSEAHAINHAGQIIVIGSPQGMFQFPQAERRSFLMESDGRFRDLGFLAGADQTMAFGINEVGTVVGSSGTPGHRDAFCWTRTTGMIKLPLPPGYVEGFARRVNSHGWILGAVIDRTRKTSLAVIWSPDMKPHLLNRSTLGHQHGVGEDSADPDWMDVRFGLSEDGSVATSILIGDRTVPVVLRLVSTPQN